jgi:hypothetical protein
MPAGTDLGDGRFLRERHGRTVSVPAHLLEFSSLLSEAPSSAPPLPLGLPLDIFDASFVSFRQ